MDKWETVDKDAGIMRMKVLGGWLVKVTQIFNMTVDQPGPLAGSTRKVTMPFAASIAVTFVPDAEYDWKIAQSVKPGEIIEIPKG